MKILVLLPRFPRPLDKGDRLRAWHQLLGLAKRHELFVCALAHAPVADADRRALESAGIGFEVIRMGAAATAAGLASALVGGEPLQSGWFRSARARRRIEARIASFAPDRILVQLVRMADYARGHESIATLDFMDAFSWGMARRADHAPSWLAPFLRLEAGRLARAEADCLARFPRATVISAQDRGRLPAHPAREEIRVVGNGVDFDRFRPGEAAPDADLLFVGNMAYPPNILAARILAQEVLPAIRRHRPARLLIAGTSPSREVRRLAGDGIEVTGRLDDIAAAYGRGRLFVAPLVVSIGLQNKLLEAMASGLPVITTEPARRALRAGDAEVLVGDDPAALADHAVRLLGNPGEARRLAERGLAFARERFRWDDAVRELEAVLLG